MRGVLADINAAKHVRAIISVCTSDAWRELWIGLGLSVASFIDDFRGTGRLFVP